MTQETLLEQIGKLIDTKLEPIKKEMASKKDIETLDMKIAVSFDTLSKKIDDGHTQILETITRT